MIESHRVEGTVFVTFTLHAAQQAQQASVCGDWNQWSPDADVMKAGGDSFTATVALEPGRAYRFRYLLDGGRWENDWAADSYVPNGHGSDDSVIDLTQSHAETHPVTDTTSEAMPAEQSAAPPQEVPDALATAQKVTGRPRRTRTKKPAGQSDS